jgi:hypothetical protein
MTQPADTFRSRVQQFSYLNVPLIISALFINEKNKSIAWVSSIFSHSVYKEKGHTLLSHTVRERKTQSFEAEAHLNNIIIQSVVPQRKQNTFPLQRSNSWLMLFRKESVYSDNHMKPIHTLCGQNAEFLTITAGGILSYHLALKG